MSGKQKKGKKYSDKDFIRVSIWCKPSEWETLNYKSASSGKTLSCWAIDTALAYGDKNVIVYESNMATDERGCVKSLCVESEKWDIIKKRAERYNMSISKYFLAVTIQ